MSSLSSLSAPRSNTHCGAITGSSDVSNPPNGDETFTTPFPFFNLPWDIIAAVIGRADWPTLKAMSLACRDLYIEAAPALYRCFGFKVTFSLRPCTAVEQIQYQQKVLFGHSHLSHVKRIHVTLEAAKNGRSSSSGGVFDCIITLFKAIRSIKQLESLDLDLFYGPAVVTGFLRVISLPSSLKQLRIFTNDPFLLSLGNEFWARHVDTLRSLAIIAPPAIESTDVPQTFAALEHLHIREGNLTPFIGIPRTTRSLTVDNIRDSDIAGLYNTLTTPSTSPPSETSATVLTGNERGARLKVKLDQDVAASKLDEFDFGYTETDPSRAYAALVGHMPRLRKLIARHGAFPSPQALESACRTISDLRHLEEFEWDVGQVGPIVDDAHIWYVCRCLHPRAPADHNTTLT